jgi:hypothetical protein
MPEGLDAIGEAERILKEARGGGKKGLANEMFSSILENKRSDIAISPDDEKALILRDHCIELVRSLNSLLPRPILQSKVEERPEAVTKIGEEVEWLRLKSGIKPKLYEGDDPKTFTNNPLKAAEYAASHLLFGIQENGRYIDFVFPSDPHGDLHRLNRRIQAYIELTDIYLGEQLGTTREKAK